MVEEIVGEAGMVVNVIEAPPVGEVSMDKTRIPMQPGGGYVILSNGSRIPLSEAPVPEETESRLPEGILYLANLVRSQ